MSSCCIGKRAGLASGSPRLSAAPIVFGAASPAEIAPVESGMSFGKAVLAGVTIYGVTRVIDSIFGGGSRK